MGIWYAEGATSRLYLSVFMDFSIGYREKILGSVRNDCRFCKASIVKECSRGVEHSDIIDEPPHLDLVVCHLRLLINFSMIKQLQFILGSFFLILLLISVLITIT